MMVRVYGRKRKRSGNIGQIVSIIIGGFMGIGLGLYIVERFIK